jgi:hypothetical protein
MHRPTTFLTLCLLAGTAQAGQAQASGSIPMRQPTFQHLRDRQWIRVTGAGLTRREGRVAQRSATEIVLATDAEPLRLPATAVDTLWTRGTSTVAGLVVGAFLGAALGAAAGATWGEENAGSARLVLGAGTLGAVSLGVIGAAIGTAIPRWRRQYP